MGNAYIVGAVRTPGGKKDGKLKNWHPSDLGALVLDELVERTGAKGEMIDDVIFGCVSQSGAQAGNVARNAVLSSKLPESVPGTSVDRQCGSSQQAIHFAAQAVMSETQDIVIAGGVEVMSQVPIGSNIIDSLFFNGSLGAIRWIPYTSLIYTIIATSITIGSHITNNIFFTRWT